MQLPLLPDRRAGLDPNLGSATFTVVRVFNRSTVTAFGDSHADVREPLLAWHAEVEGASWSGPEDVKKAFPSASIINDERIVFNIKGNKYRVVVGVKFQFFVVYIKPAPPASPASPSPSRASPPPASSRACAETAASCRATRANRSAACTPR